MSLNEFLKRREIRKTVDPGAGSGPTPNPLPADQPTAELIKTRPVTRVAELQSYAQTVSSETESTIQEIYTANKDNLDFIKYYNEVKRNRFNPMSLLSDPSSRPSLTTSVTKVKAYERAVFLKSTDPRAPFIRGLAQIGDEVNLIQFTLESVWKSIVTPTPLYSEFQYNEMVRMALVKEKQHLDLLSNHVDLIRNNSIRNLSECFSKHLVKNTLNESLRESQNKGGSLIKTIESLKHVHTLVTWSKFFQTEHWEQIQDNLQKNIGDVFGYITQKVVNAGMYAIVGGIQDRAHDLVNKLSIDSVLRDLSFGAGDALGDTIIDCFDLYELKSQTELSLQRILGEIENDFLVREKIGHDMDENRSAAILVSQRNSKANQLLNTLEELINQLEILKSQPDFDEDEALDRITNAVRRRSQQYGSEPQINLPGIVPFNG